MDEQTLADSALPYEFYRTDGISLARSLIGKVLVHRTSRGWTAGIISETEAYMGITDKASHAYGGRRTARTETMYLPGGYAYVYLIYGIYSCMNITANEKGNPEAVLIRGVVPLLGFDAMLENTREFNENRLKKTSFNYEKYRSNPALLTDGPGKLCAAMALDRTLDKVPLTAKAPVGYPQIFVSDLGFTPEGGISESERIGISYAEEAAFFPWRFTSVLPFQSPTTVQLNQNAKKITQ